MKKIAKLLLLKNFSSNNNYHQALCLKKYFAIVLSKFSITERKEHFPKMNDLFQLICISKNDNPINYFELFVSKLCKIFLTHELLFFNSSTFSSYVKLNQNDFLASMIKRLQNILIVFILFFISPNLVCYLQKPKFSK